METTTPTWFEIKAKYQKTDDSGIEKWVSEQFLFDACSFTEAETRVNKELEPLLIGDLHVFVIKMSNIGEVIANELANRWFKVKVLFIATNEETGKESKSYTYILVQSTNAKDAYESVELSLTDCVIDYEIPKIEKTKIIGVFNYEPENTDNTKEPEDTGDTEE